MNEALFFQSVIAILITCAWAYLQYVGNGTVWRVGLGVAMFVVWYVTGELTLTVYPAYGLGPSLLYWGFSLIGASYAVVDSIRLVQDDQEWWD